MANWCNKCARKPYVGCDERCPIFGKHLEEVAKDYFKLQAEAEPAVRCKECIHRLRGGYCKTVTDARATKPVNDNFFCSYGKRRGEDE